MALTASVTGPGNINGWTTIQNYYNIVIGAQLAQDEAVNGTFAPNQRQYNWTYLTNYTVRPRRAQAPRDRRRPEL